VVPSEDGATEAFPDGAGRMLGGADLCYATSATGTSTRSHRVDVIAAVRHPVGWIAPVVQDPLCPAPQLGRYCFSDSLSHFSSLGKPRPAFGTGSSNCDAIVAVPTVMPGLWPWL
jgi:hypothetical protein